MEIVERPAQRRSALPLRSSAHKVGDIVRRLRCVCCVTVFVLVLFSFVSLANDYLYKTQKTCVFIPCTARGHFLAVTGERLPVRARQKRCITRALHAAEQSRAGRMKRRRRRTKRRSSRRLPGAGATRTVRFQILLHTPCTTSR